MKTLVTGPLLLCALALQSGCYTTDARATNNKQPGPAVGAVVGTAAGAVVGNVAGVVVGGTEAATNAAKVPFNTERRIIRQWRNEKTSDGRTIAVAYEIEVDAQGRPVGEAKPVK